MHFGEGGEAILGRLTSAERELPPPIVSEDYLAAQCAGDEDLEQLLGEMLNLSARYAVSVAKFDQIIAEEQDDETALERIDEARGRTHDALIASVNALARNMNQRGRDGTWVQKIYGNRGAYGKMAILLALHGLPG
jgi:hypothetical protein